MPWKPSDAQRHTHRAKSAKKKRQWAHVADSVLKRTGDEGRAVRAANSVIRNGAGASGRTGKYTHSAKRKVKPRKSPR